MKSYNDNGKLKLHLGCGKRYLPGWTHIDLVSYPHIDYLHRIDKLEIFNDDSVDDIYACHCLEHFKRHEVADVLREWARVLKSNGWIHIAVPSFEAIIEEYLENKKIEMVMGLLYGRQDYEYNIHYHTFDFENISLLLTNANFDNIEIYRWEDFLPAGFDDYSRAYLPHMDFEHGRLMSLNVVAKKR